MSGVKDLGAGDATGLAFVIVFDRSGPHIQRLDLRHMAGIFRRREGGLVLEI